MRVFNCIKLQKLNSFEGPTSTLWAGNSTQIYLLLDGNVCQLVCVVTKGFYEIITELTRKFEG